jgi:hypothetical protein
MQLKALTKSATGMTDEQCEAGKMPGLRGGRELTIAQVAKLPRSGRNWLGDFGEKVPARMNFYHGGEPNEIATPRQVGARNDKRAWCWLKETATKGWRRDLNLQVSSLFLAPVAETSPDFSYRLVFAAGQRTGWLGLMNRTTISAQGAFSTGRVPVGRGQ